MTEVTGNSRQHAPRGEPPAGWHPSIMLDPIMHQGAGLELYGRFMRPGELVFDIGANIGQRTGWFLDLGARVVAVEPQANQLEHVDPAATRVLAAVAASDGRAPFYVCSGSPYMSTLEAGYVDRVHGQPGIGGNVFEPPSPVETVTMDTLIEQYGLPVFAKIDVEGGEVGVLAGLSQPIHALSFEVHSFDPDKAETCLAMLGELGRYRFTYSPLESFRVEPWPPSELAVFGDVYAVLEAS